MQRLRTIGHKIGPPARVKVRLPKKVVDPFYQSAEWVGLMKAIIRARGRACQDPDHDVDLPRSGVRIFGDHVVEKRDGGALLDPRNIMLRCGTCHSRKSAKTRAERLHAGVGGLIT